MAQRTQRGHRNSKSGKKLTEALRQEVVVRLATYEAVNDILEWLLEEHGVSVDYEAIRYYDPTVGQTPAARWIELFHHARTKFLNEISEIPIANRAWRLKQLGRDYERTRVKDPDTARKQLELAAKEVSGYFNPQSKHPGKMTEPATADLPERTHDENANMLSDRLLEAIKRLPGAQKGTTTVQ